MMNTLTRRAFWLLLLLTACVCLSGWLLIWFFLPDTGISRVNRQRREDSAALVSALRATDPDSGITLMRQFERETGIELGMTTADHIPVDPYTRRPLANGQTVSGTEYPFRYAGEQTEYFLVIPETSVRTAQMRRAFLLSIPVILFLTLLLSLLTAKLFSYWAVQPIRRINKIAQQMANLDFSWYCPDLRGDEIGTLSESLNTLSDKLQAALAELNDRNKHLQTEIELEKERERRRMLFLSGVTHELKTPVAVVIGQLEGMQANIGVYRDRDKYLGRCAEIMQSLNDFIREILLVSHLDMTDTGPAPEMDLSDALQLLAEDHAAYAEEEQIAFRAETAPDCMVCAEPMLLNKALGNILGNAVSHTPASGTVTVRLTDSADAAVLTVENTPAHIGEEHLPHVFEAFYRADPAARHSSGLGLYITATILDMYKFPYRIENTAEGVCFTVSFPKPAAE